MARRAELAILFTALAWGFTFVLVKSALEDCSTYLFLALRFSLASVTLAMVFRRRYAASFDTPMATVVRGVLVSGSLLFLGYALQTTGLRLTSASNSAFLTGLYIVLVPLFASLVQKAAPRFVELLGAALATAGTVVMTSRGGGWNLGLSHLNWGDVLTIGCAFAYAAHMISVEHFSRRIGFELLTLGQIAMVAGWSWLAVLLVEPARVVWSPGLLAAVGVTAILATALPFALYTWAQRETTAARAALLFATEPVFAGLMAWWFGGELWTIVTAAGAAMILSGILVVELKPSPLPAHPSG